MIYAIDANAKQATEVLLFVFKYSPDLHKVYWKVLSRLSNLDVYENGAVEAEMAYAVEVNKT